MKRIFSFFLLVIMTLNVALPLVERLRMGDVYELTETSTDDADEKDKTEKEKGKESLTFLHLMAIKSALLDLERFNKSAFPANDHPVSELYASQPELPPEA